jgi:hypothetical protein
MPAQPGLRTVDIPDEFTHQRPESWTMVHVPQVRDFMCDDVVEHKGRRENEPPRKRKSPRR